MKNVMMFLIGGVALLGIVGGLGSSNTKSEPTKKVASKADHPCVVTMEKFSNMKAGMSYYQIERDIGCPARELSSSAIGGYKTVMVAWDGTGSFGANMNATFQNGVLVGKAQFGLR